MFDWQSFVLDRKVTGLFIESGGANGFINSPALARDRLFYMSSLVHRQIAVCPVGRLRNRKWDLPSLPLKTPQG